MQINRIVPYVESVDLKETEGFYTSLLGLKVAMDGPDFLGLTSPANRSAQILVAREGVELPLPRFGIDVGEATAVGALHAEAIKRGLEVVYPLSDEPWGIRRFFVRDPGGTVLSVLAHLDRP